MNPRILSWLGACSIALAVVSCLGSDLFWVRQVPGYEHVDYRGPHRPEDVSDALSVIRRTVDMRMGRLVQIDHLSIEEVSIEEARTRCAPDGEACLVGSTIVIPAVERLSHSALAHEVMHYVHDRYDGRRGYTAGTVVPCGASMTDSSHAGEGAWTDLTDDTICHARKALAIRRL